MIPNFLAQKSIYSDAWCRLRSMRHALKRVISSKECTLSPLDRESLQSLQQILAQTLELENSSTDETDKMKIIAQALKGVASEIVAITHAIKSSVADNARLDVMYPKKGVAFKLDKLCGAVRSLGVTVGQNVLVPNAGQITILEAVYEILGEQIEGIDSNRTSGSLHAIH